MNNLEKAKKLLCEGEYTCVMCSDSDTLTFTARGVKPLVSLLQSEKRFDAYSAADKVVGRATAFLYVLLGVKRVYANVISRAALAVLNDLGVEASFGKLVDNIINRTGDGICPFEAAVLDVNDPNEAYRAILDKMQQMRIEI
jgi:hypothetical protein